MVRAPMAGSGSVVLYVEDEETDVIFMQMAFEGEGVAGLLRVVTDGQTALNYLSGTGPFGDRQQHPIPGAILLDLNLPEVHGFEVLRWIRENPGLTGLPVVVFSSSVREEDDAKARALGANDFVQKPNAPALFRNVVRDLRDRWLR